MSTTLIDRPEYNYTLTGFWGGNVRGYSLQITSDNGYVQLTREGAEQLIADIRRYYLGDGSDGTRAVPLSPTPEMIDAGAQRLVRWEDDCTWPGSWDALDVAAARNNAERVWREMWLAAGEEQ